MKFSKQLTGCKYRSVVTIVCGCAFTLFGYDQALYGGVASGDAFGKQFKHPSASLTGQIAALYDIGCLAGSLLSVMICHKLGHRKDRVVADNSELVTLDGGFAEYCAYPAKKVFKIKNISDVNATLIEPASCAAHGADRVAAKAGSSVLLFGAGPTGLILAQMLKKNGGCHVVIAAPEGLNMDLARSLDAGHGYVPLSRQNPLPELQKLKCDNPKGFDIVIEATGNIQILDDSINYVRRGGKLLVYGVFAGHDRVSWSPSKILNEEITILSSFSQVHKFPTAIDYLESGQVNVDGIVNKTFRIEEWKQCLEEVRNKKAIKAAITFG